MAGTQAGASCPHKGTGPALNDPRSGPQVDMTFTSHPDRHALTSRATRSCPGVVTAKRSSAMPDIPTIADRWQGVEGYDVSCAFWRGRPKGTPADRVKLLNQVAFTRALATDKVRQTFAVCGLEACLTIRPPTWGASSRPRSTNGPRWCSNQAFNWTELNELHDTGTRPAAGSASRAGAPAGIKVLTCRAS